MNYTVIAETLDTGNNVTSSFSIDRNILYIIDGDGNYSEVKDNDILGAYKNIYTEIYWHFDDSGTLNAGDYVEINLPSKYLTFYEFSETDLKLSDGVSIGKFKVSDGKLKIIFNDLAKNYSSLKNGYIKMVGKTTVDKGKDDVIDGGLTFPDFVIPGSGGGSEVFETPNYGELNKIGTQFSNKIFWSIRVNYDTLQSAMTGGNPPVKNDVVLVDTLTKGQKVVNVLISNVIPILSKNNIISANYATISQMSFNKLVPSLGESYDDFYNRIKTSPGSYGIYTDDTGQQIVLIGFGDLHGSLSGNETLEQLISTVNSDDLTDLEKENTINGLNKLSEVTKGKMHIASFVSISTEVDKNTPTQDIANKAELRYNSGESIDSSTIVNYQTIDSGAEGILPQNVKVIKKDDSGNLLPNITFKLQKLDSDGNFSDYKPKDGGQIERSTDSIGEIKFSNLDYGKYKIVEVSQLPEYDKPIYSINGVDGVDEFSVTANDNKGFLITVVNPIKSVTPILTEVSGTKTWNDKDNQDGIRPDSITVNLLADGKQVDSKPVTADDNWQYTFNDLPKYQNGIEIVYTVTEDTVTDYTSVNNGFDFTNSYTPGKTNIGVSKIWEDNNNQDGKRPTSIQVQLYADEVAKGVPVTLTSADNWAYNWTDLDIKTAGKAIKYTVKELDVPSGYQASKPVIDKGNVTITNTHIAELTEVSGTKTWNDKDNQDGIRPDSITVNLLADGKQVDSKPVTADDNWQYTFNDLPKYQNGIEIVYTVTEDIVENYITQISGFDITNTYNPGKISATVTKHWEDNNNQDGIRPNSIKIQLHANGEKQGEAIELNGKGNWTYSWKELDMADKDGKPIQYTISEVGNVKGYVATITGENTGNLMLTNTHNPTTTKPKIPDNSNKTGNNLPKTGEQKVKWITIVGTIILLAISAFYLYQKRKISR
nr:Cna B-type domain-containing protein [Vagococcus sp. DIV0080]